jgi:hypothetical protein
LVSTSLGIQIQIQLILLSLLIHITHQHGKNCYLHRKILFISKDINSFIIFLQKQKKKKILFILLFHLWIINAATINAQDKEALEAFRGSTNIASQISDWAVRTLALFYFILIFQKYSYCRTLDALQQECHVQEAELLNCEFLYDPNYKF